MCMDTAAAMYRLEQLRQVFLNITSPQHLTDTMAEGGCLLAHLIQQQWVPANGFFKDQAAAALVDPVPRWDTDTQMFRRGGLWQLYANEYSDSPRTVLHTQPAVGPGWIVRRSTQAADQTEPVVTETELPRTDVTQQTKWGQDYAQQGQRYALFVSELLAELVKQERTITEQDVPAVPPIDPAQQLANDVRNYARLYLKYESNEQKLVHHMLDDVLVIEELKAMLFGCDVTASKKFSALWIAVSEKMQFSADIAIEKHGINELKFSRKPAGT